MNEKFPMHIMVKPEGLELFPNYLTSKIEMLESLHGEGQYRKLRTTLTPEEVEMIYPRDTAPKEFKEYLAEHPTEHHFILGDADIYRYTRAMKGKYGIPTGIRGELAEVLPRMGEKLERWQNFVHSTDDVEETRTICFNFNKDTEMCSYCVANKICYSVKK